MRSGVYVHACERSENEVYYTAAAKYLHRSLDFVRKWVKRFQLTKSVNDVHGRGSSRVNATSEDKKIIKHFKNKYELSLRSEQSLLAKKNIKVIVTIRLPLLTENHTKIRLE